MEASRENQCSNVHIFVCRCPYSRDAMSRAVVDRVTGIQDGRLPQGYTQHRPVFHCTSVKFQHGRPPLTGGCETHTPCSACRDIILYITAWIFIIL